MTAATGATVSSSPSARRSESTTSADALTMMTAPAAGLPGRVGAFMRITTHLATSQDQSVQPRYAATWRGVMPVGLLRSHGRLLRPISACDRMKLQTLFDAAHLLICCETRWAGRDAGRPTDSQPGRTRIGGNSVSTNTATRSRLAAAVPQFSVSDVLATVHYYRDRPRFCGW